MRRSALLVAALLLAAGSAALGATAGLQDPGPHEAGTVTPAVEPQPASGPDREATLGYLTDCDVQALSPAGTRAYRLLERLVADGLSLDEAGAAFDARGALMDEASCWPDGYPQLDLGNDIAYPPR
jgi:hypothetical protein